MFARFTKFGSQQSLKSKSVYLGNCVSGECLAFITHNVICRLGNAKRTMEGLRGDSLVQFVSTPPNLNPAAPPPLYLARILDMAPITITDQTPMETVVDMFRKLGLRQTLVTHNGSV